jgi:hypothetical protein
LLLDAICNAAEWHEQISEGKSLSEREEAVLQALELLTRNADKIVWVKGTELREKIRSLLGQPADEMGNTQWIGHVLKLCRLLRSSGQDSTLKQPNDNHDASHPELACVGGETGVEQPVAVHRMGLESVHLDLDGDARG